jgi:Tol biopolymer transport system component
VHATIWTASKGSSSLWTVGPDGSRLERLPSQFAVSDPAWSPTGKEIAFIQYDDFEYDVLHVIDLAKRSNTKLASASDFAWSPSGDMIVSFGGADSTFSELIRVRDGRRRRLPRVTSASWSPDGRRIAFERDGGIWIADSLGNRQRRVATGRNPSWSPRGDTIAFAAAACGPRQGIWLLRVATGAAHRVTRGCRTIR